MSSDNTVRCDYMLPYFPKRIVCDALRAILWTALLLLARVSEPLC